MVHMVRYDGTVHVVRYIWYGTCSGTHVMLNAVRYNVNCGTCHAKWSETQSEFPE